MNHRTTVTNALRDTVLPKTPMKYQSLLRVSKQLVIKLIVSAVVQSQRCDNAIYFLSALPMKTTSTAANPAVAMKISMRRAFVKITRIAAKAAVIPIAV